jgi:hypothetical protein
MPGFERPRMVWVEREPSFENSKKRALIAPPPSQAEPAVKRSRVRPGLKKDLNELLSSF